MMFSNAVSDGDANRAELFAIKKVFKLFGASKWVGSRALMIESDFNNAILWTSEPKKAPRKLKRESRSLESFKRVVGVWSISKIFREDNRTADELAKSGLHRHTKYLSTTHVLKNEPPSSGNVSLFLLVIAFS
ncbi:Uncharacterized protein TCM_032337 [Theobroma cacao]|uniref:Uncharacterized protein n=1 Tax=Theobroma cacao TaxID=3641 RepID=A0A061FAJ5_THECC|nr:Uncharacterized protein TCM_032337 [Theobroma cacao]